MGTLEISDATLAELRRQAERAGQSVEDFLKTMLGIADVNYDPKMLDDLLNGRVTIRFEYDKSEGNPGRI